ncbi:MAG: polyphenol oxidase family protein [candidate division Zixibacteria bacterium]|nr:polyphenol oxidase family protein [candidate division Zixibacteria bacterium]
MKEPREPRPTETAQFQQHSGRENRLTFSVLGDANLIHSFWGRPGSQSDICLSLKSNRNYLNTLTAGFPSRKIHSLRQVHSNRTLIVDGGEQKESEVPGHDAIFTNRRDIYIAITVADCLPIFAYDGKNQIAGLIHAGWRGTFLGIAARAIREASSTLGFAASRAKFVLGPCIQSCCFKVSSDVATLFRDEHVASRTGSAFVDIPSVNRSQILQAGARPENIHVVPECTYCNPERFYSYRRTGDLTQKMIALMGLS